MNISWPDGLGSSLRCCWQWIPFILSRSYQMPWYVSSSPWKMSMRSDLRFGRCFLKRKRNRSGEKQRDCLTNKCWYIFWSSAFSDVKGSASHAVRWRGVAESAPTAWAPRGLFLSCCAGHQWNRVGGVSHQTGRAHLFSTLPRRHSGSTSLQRWGRVSDITDMHHNECLRPSITWPSGLYLALSSLWHISFPLLHKAVPLRSTKTCQTAAYGEGLELLASLDLRGVQIERFARVMVCKHRCEEAGEARSTLTWSHSVMWTSAAQVHRTAAFLGRRAQESIVVLLLKLMGHQLLDGKINGAFECWPMLDWS